MSKNKNTTPSSSTSLVPRDVDDGFGLGPWFIALIFNTENRYELVIHTYAYRVAWFKGNGWFNAQLIGPFDSESQAHYVYEEWKRDGEKNREKLLQKGFNLVSKYRNLRFWSEYGSGKLEEEHKKTIKDLRNEN